MTTCANCNRPDAAGGKYCAYCGAPLSVTRQDAAPAAEAPTAQMPTAPPSGPPPTYGYPSPEPQQPSPGYYAYPPQALPPQSTLPPPSKSNQGLIAGIIVASVLAVCGIIAAVVVAASGGADAGPTIAAAAATTTPPPPVTQTVTTVTETAAKTPTTPAKKRVVRPTPVAPPVQRRTSIQDSVAVRNTIRAHWSNKEAGNYEAAYALFAPGFQRHDAWIQSMVSDNLSSATIDLGQVTFASSSRATAVVNHLRTYANDGCHTWNGSYAMSRIGGRWLIADSNLNRMSC